MQRRSIVARLGIAALNLLGPGLGVLRAGDLRWAATLLLALPVAVLVLLVVYALVPAIGFSGYVAIMTLGVLIYGLTLFGSIALSWRRSRIRLETPPVWSRWYMIVAVLICLLVFAEFARSLAHSYYKPFYLPSENMAPTLMRSDRMLASMRPVGEIARGDIVLIATPDSTYVKRVAALAGDRIAMVEGQVVLNGRAVTQRLVRRETVNDFDGPISASRLAERFPGERQPHEIYDLGLTEIDDMAEQVVRAGHIFVLGDNRDRSADSRVSHDRQGLEQVPVTHVIGRPLFRYWSRAGGIAETPIR